MIPMEREMALDSIDELMEQQEGISIRLMQINEDELSQKTHALAMAWRDLALKIGGIELEPLESLRRHFEKTGE